MHPHARSLLGMVSRIAADWRTWREEVRTETLLNGLPHQIRKDIGWPDAHASSLSRRAGNRFRR